MLSRYPFSQSCRRLPVSVAVASRHCSRRAPRSVFSRQNSYIYTLGRNRRSCTPNFYSSRSFSQSSCHYASEEQRSKPVSTLEELNAYDPINVESQWYEWWVEQQLFRPEYGNQKAENGSPFVMVFPPPNVTGKLHIGHALATALQDTLIRWHRMKGVKTLLLPGCDHAGIATQSVVEKQLWKRERKTRHDLGREKFVKKIWEWKGEYHQSITNAMRRMGASFDWSREAFTMDKNLSAAVAETFVRLHKEGLIYRDKRIVRWCPALQTVLSDSEVEDLSLDGRKLLSVPGHDKKVEFGVITYFKYPVLDSSDYIEVATTRPETIPGDTGIAVHPSDPRYKNLVGKFAVHPFVDRLLPIVADESVDPDFGTGAVKITPAHDYEDEKRGKQHGLESINILNDDGTLNANAGPFNGLKRFEARYQITAELQGKGLFTRKEDNPMTLKICPKSGDVIEPVIKPQWFVRVKELAQAAADAVKDGQIQIKPESAVRRYFEELNKLEDWCISRQLWWGHQAPAYLVLFEGQDEESSSANGDLWVVAKTEEEAQQIASERFPKKNFKLMRDPDVLDTWFSSALWPFSTLGWPQETEDLRTFYPTSVLETGWDILGIWVARMIMFGLKLTGSVPFREVYCHGLVRDAQGRKMSKSLGNVIDPIDVIDGITLKDMLEKLQHGNLDSSELYRASKNQKAEFPRGIPQCGADALRLSLNISTTGGLDVVCDMRQIEYHRRFCNKVFQAAKFFLLKVDETYTPPNSAIKLAPSTLPSQWILHRMNQAAKAVNQALEKRDFSEAASLAHDYFRDDLCDVYIENSKNLITDSTAESRHETLQTLHTALEGGLKLLHPFMPFLTEDLWQRLPRGAGQEAISISVSSYPQFNAELDNPKAEKAYELVLGVAQSIRGLTGSLFTDFERIFVQAHDQASYEALVSNFQNIVTLVPGRGTSLTVDTVLPPEDEIEGSYVRSTVSTHATVLVEVKGDIDYSGVIEKLQKKQSRLVSKARQEAKIISGKDFSKGSKRWQQAAVEKAKELQREADDTEKNVGLLQELMQKQFSI